MRNARDFLRSLLDPKETPKVPSKVREKAYYVLKHFPQEHEMAIAAWALPSLFKKDSKE